MEKDTIRAGNGISAKSEATTFDNVRSLPGSRNLSLSSCVQLPFPSSFLLRYRSRVE